MEATSPKQGLESDAFKRVKAAANLCDYIGLITGTPPQQVGNTVRFNPCPFCERRDCFNLFGEDASQFKCHSCGESGDIFTFVERYHQKSKREALKTVADHYGVELPQAKRSSATRANPLQEVLEAAVKHYRDVLNARTESLGYQIEDKPKGRGHRRETIETIELGLSDGRLAEHLQAAGMPREKIIQAGLYVEKKKTNGKTDVEWRDFFTPGLYIYPHRTESGEIGHFTLKDPRKKVDYQLRTEHRLNGLVWGNQKAIKNRVVILVEGENDFASFLDAGVSNVMYSMGSISEQQLNWLITHAHGKAFVLWFDFDTDTHGKDQAPAGIRYTRQVYRRLLQTDGCHVTVASAFMEPGEDPDDWIQKDKNGAPARIKGAVNKSLHPLQWELHIMPPALREDANAVLQHLDALNYFELLGQVDELRRDAIMTEMQKLGFSREAILSKITTKLGLAEVLEELDGEWEPAQRRSETYMRIYADRVWKYFRNHGKFFISGEDALHLFYRHKIYKLGDNMPWKALLHREARLNFTTQLAKFINEELKATCLTRGERLNSFSWIHPVNTADESLIYLNLKDQFNRICRLSPGNVEITENGTNEHSVLLAESTQMKRFEYDPEVNAAGAMQALKTLVFDAMACEPSQRYLILSWGLACFLMPLSESKALMKMEGGTGSGKTTAAKFLSLLIYGDNMVGRSTTASDFAMGSSEPLIIKDNVETDDIDKSALNFLLLAATGAQNLKRTSGTESGVTAERVNCLVAITAIEPFAKPELINRTYIIEFSKRWQRADFIETAAVHEPAGEAR